MKEQRNALSTKIATKERQVQDLVKKVNSKLPIKQDDKKYGFEVGLRFGTNSYDRHKGLAIVSELGVNDTPEPNKPKVVETKNGRTMTYN